MKKVLYLLTAAATLLFAASCARETVNPDPAFGGQTVTATVSVDLGQGLTKAYADGTTATKLLVFVYDAEKNLVASQSKTTVASAIAVEGKQATVNLRLVKGQKYSIAFWAQAADAPYTVSTTDNKTLTVTATGDANAEIRDAFYGLVPEFTASEDIQVEKQITRPFAQLNVLMALQLTEAATSSMTVTGAPNTLNLATGEVGGSADYVLATAAMTETSFDKEYEAGKNYGYAGVNYILAPAGNGGTYDIQMEVTCTSDDLGTITLQKAVPTVPLKQNYRTNITWDPAVNADYTVIVAPGTGGDDIDVPVVDYENNEFNVVIGGNTEPSASGVSVPVAVGENFSLTILDSNNHAPDAAESENPAVATVEAGATAGEYQINGIANGTTNVNFHIDSYTKVDVEAADFTVQVVVGTGTEEGVQSIAFSAETAEATIGAAFEAPTLDETNAKGEVTYASGTPATATVDETTGEVTLVAAGTTVITATAAEATVEGIHYPEATASYTLTVNEGGVVIEEGEQSIAFSAETAEATIGAAFEAPTLDVSNAQGDVTYASGTPATATVDETTGEVTLVAAGETVITATAAEVTIDNVHYPAVTASYTLTVSSGGVEPPVEATTIADIKAAFSEGALTNFEATLSNVVVTYVNGKNAYLEDETGGLLVFMDSHGFEAGKSISGTATLTGTVYNGLKEITAIADADFEFTEGATIPVTNATIAQLTANYDEYESRRVKLVGVTNATAIKNKANVNITQGSDAYVLYPKAVLSTEVPANSTFDVVGYPAIFNSTAQFNVWIYEDFSNIEAGDIVTTISGMSNKSLAAGESYTFEATTNNPNGTIVYSIQSGSDVVTLSGAQVTVKAGATVGATAVIKASVAATTGYTAAEATATITVKESGGTEKTDVLDRAFTGLADGATSYTAWTDKSGSESDAVYAGKSAASYNSIQLRSNGSDSGIITTASGGKVTKVKVTWNSNTSSGRTLDIYGKNTAYSSAADLFNNDNKGTKIGSIVMGTSTELEITDEYTFIGLRSNSGAMYIESIEITWE